MLRPFHPAFSYKIISPRRRRGSTSPPLPCVEVNPGPRKSKRSLSELHRATTPDAHRKKKRPKLSPSEKGKIIGALEAGASVHKVAQMFGIDRKTVRLWRERHKADPQLQRKKGSGRPRKLNLTTVRYIHMTALRNRRQTATSITNHLIYRVSRRTVARRLAEAGLNGRVAAKKPLLTQKHRKMRLAWARAHKHWTPAQWRRVIWTDETTVRINDTAGRQYVRRRIGERLNDNCVVTTVKGGFKVSVWGCFAGSKPGPIHRITGNLDQHKFRAILKDTAFPFIEKLINEEKKEAKEERKIELKEGQDIKEVKEDEKKQCAWVFQQDNDPKHTAKVNQNYLNEKKDSLKFSVMAWPSQSPDLNPIENAWRTLKINIRKHRRPTTEDALYELIKAEWEKLPADIFERLLESMPKRIAEVIKNRGGYTSY